MNFVTNPHTDIEANYQRVVGALSADGHCLHAFDSDKGDRLDRMELWALNGQVIAIYRHLSASGRGAKRTYKFLNFEVLRPMGADNRMDTLLREIALYPKHPYEDANTFLNKALGFED